MGREQLFLPTDGVAQRSRFRSGDRRPLPARQCLGCLVERGTRTRQDGCVVHRAAWRRILDVSRNAGRYRVGADHGCTGRRRGKDFYSKAHEYDEYVAQRELDRVRRVDVGCAPCADAPRGAHLVQRRTQRAVCAESLRSGICGSRCVSIRQRTRTIVHRQSFRLYRA